MPEGNIRRKLVQPPTDALGLFIQPDFGDNNDKWAEREIIENHNRMGFAHIANFADPFTGNTRTVDPEGRYNCGACNKHEGAQRCLILARRFKINLKSGSCRYWENLCAGDPELDYATGDEDGFYTAEDADFGVAIPQDGRDGLGFGCGRCGFQEKAVMPDSRGRNIYCRKGDFRTFKKEACCAINSAPSIEFEGNSPKATSYS